MIIKNEICPLTNEECGNIQACKYSMGRFRVPVCFPNRQEKINQVYKEELKAREEILERGKFATTGNNYKKELDLNYKDAVIDRQVKRKMGAC